MAEIPLSNYNVFDDFKEGSDVDDIVRIVLDEQKHSLTEEDQKILRDHEQLRNEFHTLQNVDFSNSKESPSKSEAIDGSPPVWFDLIHVDSSVVQKSDVYFVDVEAIEQPSLATENVEPSNAELDNTIANFIQDENVKTEVLRLNQLIGLNLAKNRSLSDDAKNLRIAELKLKRKLTNIERKITTFSPEEVRIKRIKRRKGTDCANTGHQKRTYFYRFGAPYFKTKNLFPAHRNPDLQEIVRTNQPMNIRLPRIKRILPNDAAFLEQSILKQLKAKRVEQLQKCRKDAEDRLKRDPNNTALADETRCINRTIKETEEITQISVTKEWNIPIDFMALTQSSRFSAEDYERIWRLIGSPTLTRGEFSVQEVSELQSLAKKYNEQDWDRIANEMPTKRSGFTCFTKYVNTQKKGKNQPWTKEENELLHSLCISADSFSKSDSRFQFWKKIRRHFPHRSYTQVHSHWTYVLEPRLKKGRFTPEEKKLMLKMFNDGKSHKEIAETLQNRSCVQVRTHFDVMLQKEISRGNWTSEEEEKLLQLIEKYGTHDWVTISKELGTRNRSQCRLKYSVYLKNNQRFTMGTRAPKDFWTEEENEMFKELLSKYGTNFRKMREEMPTKTRDQIRHKYHRMKHKAEFRQLVDPMECKRKSECDWTNEELEQFKQLLMVHGTQYKRIRPFMPRKTVCQLRYKYYVMKKEWNLSLPSVGESAHEVGKSNRKPKCDVQNESISTSSASIPATYVSKSPQTLTLPEEWFENLAPVSSAHNFSATSSQTSYELSASTSDLLSISSQKKENSADPCPETLQLATSVSKPSTASSKCWSSVELEHFKQLLMVHGPDYKKISSIMPNKSIRQLRWKYYSMRNVWDLSKFPAKVPDFNVEKCKTSTIPSVVAGCKNSCKTKRKQSTLKREDVDPLDNPSAVISEVTVVPSAPPEISSDAVSAEEKSTASLNASRKQKHRTKELSSLKTVWTDDDVEKFKALIMEHGLNFKKIGEIMTEKTANQLKYKYYNLRKINKIASVEKSNVTAKPKSNDCQKTAVTTPVPVSFHSESPSELPLPINLYENVGSKSSPPMFVTSEEHSLMLSNGSNLSMCVDSEDGFAGFPAGENQESLSSFRDLIPLRRIETIEHIEHPGSSYEQMIVPERISETDRELCDISRNEYPLPDNNLDGNLGRESVLNQTDLNHESGSDGVVEMKREIVNDIKEEDRRNEFSA